MFTFRDRSEQNIHPHRLLYLHSTEKDKKQVTKAQRFKTQPYDMQQNSKKKQGYYYTANNADISKNSRYSSQRKIKYFDLDLKSLLDTTNFTSESASEKQQNGITTESIIPNVHSQNRKQVSTKHPQPLTQSSNFRNISSIRTKNSNSPQSKNKISGEVLKEIENLFQKEYIAQIENIQRVKDFKKAKIIDQKNKQFKEKYTKIKMNQYQPCQKLFPSNHLKNKTKNSRENHEGLELKRVERFLVDKMGNEYKVTIQKIL